MTVSGKEVGIAEIERGRDQSGHVDNGACPEQNSIGVDQEYAPVGLQRAHDARRIVADNAIKNRGCSGLLGKVRNLVLVYGEALPVDDGAGNVGNGEGIANGGEVGLAVHHIPPYRISLNDLCKG